MDTGQTPAKTAPKLFARQATGLVRWIPRERRGVKLELTYAEIPPE
jgi:hypothetical protein